MNLYVYIAALDSRSPQSFQLTTVFRSKNIFVLLSNLLREHNSLGTSCQLYQLYDLVRVP